MGSAAIPVVLTAASLFSLIASPAAAAEGDPAFQLAAVCAACHRLDRGDIGIPSGAGLDAESLVRVLLAYKSGERQGQIMRAVARSLSNEEIAIVAHYLAAQRKETKQP
jgi:cytochrome subunit of sulfide dehydrogenase